MITICPDFARHQFDVQTLDGVTGVIRFDDSGAYAEIGCAASVEDDGSYAVIKHDDWCWMAEDGDSLSVERAVPAIQKILNTIEGLSFDKAVDVLKEKTPSLENIKEGDKVKLRLLPDIGEVVEEVAEVTFVTQSIFWVSGDRRFRKENGQSLRATGYCGVQRFHASLIQF